MTTTLTSITAHVHTNDLLREAQCRRRYVEVRRVAVIRPEGAHFKLWPIRVSLEAAGADEQRGGPPRPPRFAVLGRTT
jgi:hypothetical protein